MLVSFFIRRRSMRRGKSSAGQHRLDAAIDATEADQAAGIAIGRIEQDDVTPGGVIAKRLPAARCRTRPLPSSVSFRGR